MMGRRSAITEQAIEKAAQIVATYTARERGWRGVAKIQIAAELQISERTAHDLFKAALASEEAAAGAGQGPAEEASPPCPAPQADGPQQMDLLPAELMPDPQPRAYRDPSTGALPTRGEMREELIRHSLDILRDPMGWAKDRLAASKTLIDLYGLDEAEEEDPLDPVEATRMLAREITGVLGLPQDAFYLPAHDTEEEETDQ
jgi:hypothetical protein